MATPRFCESCGAALNEGVHFCAACGHPITQPASAEPAPPPPAPTPAPTSTPAPTPAPAPAAMSVSASPQSEDRSRRPWLIVLILVALVALGGIIFAITNRDDSGSHAPIAGGEVFLEPAAERGADPFTASVAAEPVPAPAVTTTSSTPASTVPGVITATQGSLSGLYGGTRSSSSCDREKMIAFLQANPDKAKAWAGVVAIDVASIPSYVRGLTPVVLTRDTRVTNHGYANGRATPRQSVLQAGTAVLVDQYGIPRAKCGCGNPLAPPVPTTATPKYVGVAWPGFSTTNVTVIVRNVTVNNFVLVDLDTGATFRRPAGTTGGGDTATTPTSLPPATTPPTTAPAVKPTTLLDISSIAGVSNGPTQPSLLSLDRASEIVSIVDYHWNSARGATPGTIGLRATDGTMYGPWPATGSPGQGGVPNAYWTAHPNETLPPGTYDVVDSDPGSWAWASDTNGRGMVTITGYSMGPSVNGG
jgi:hypothetical protein